VWTAIGNGKVGNILAITSGQGSLNTCLITRTAGVAACSGGTNPGTLCPTNTECMGGGTCGPVTGVTTIDLSGSNHGLETSVSPIQTEVIIGKLCPQCSAGLPNICGANPADGASTGGPNAGNACKNPGADDAACPPSLPASPPVLPNPLNLTTETATLNTPTNNPAGGVTNTHSAFCGDCDGDNTIGCQSDQECNALGDCTAGVGNGCCQFATSAGAFGDTTKRSLTAQGTRGPYLPKLSGTFCTGFTNSIVDGVVGLPGPVRLSNIYLNTVDYDDK